MRKLLLLFGCLELLTFNLFAQTAGDFRSFATGAWNNVNTWQRFDGVSWINPAPHTPTNADGVITIQAHTVNIPNSISVTVDQVSIIANANAILAVDAGGTLILNGSGADLTFVTGLARGRLLVTGTLTVNQGATIVNSATNRLFILDGGRYRHNYTSSAGTIYTANWAGGVTGSTLEFVGYTNPGIAAAGMNQTFHHVIWNCTNQSDNIDLNLNGSSTAINGNLTISSTGSGFYLIFGDASSYTLNIGGNFIVNNSSNFTLTGFSATTSTVNLAGNFNYTSDGYSYLAFTGNASLIVAGTFTISNASGIIDLAGDAGNGTISSAGHFTVAGALARTASGVATVNFNGASAQTFSYTGSPIADAVNFVIQNPAIVDMGTSAFTGAGTFNLNAGATLRVGSADGLVTGTSLGNVRVNGSRTYAASSNIIYNGTVAQNLGSEWGSGALSAVAVNLNINNSSVSGVTNNVVGGTSVVGVLTLTQGSLNIGNSNSLQIQGVFNGNGGTIGGDPTSNLIFSGSGALNGNLGFKTGTEFVNNFTISRPAIGGVPISLASSLEISGILSFASDLNLRINGVTLSITGTGNITQTGSGGITRTSGTSNISITGSGSLTNLPFVGAPQFNDVNIGKSATWNTSASVAGTLTLSGTATLTHSSGLNMIGGSVLSRAGGTNYSGPSPSASGAYDVTYLGGTLISGNELPSNSTDLRNLTSSSNVTLNKSITINGDVSITSGTFDASTFNITMAGAAFAVAGGSFTMNSASSINFTRSGMTTITGSSLQFPNFTISSAPTTVSAPASFSVSGTWDNNGIFTPNTGTVIFNGTSGTQFIDANGQPFFNVDFAGSGTKSLQGPLDVNGSLDIHSTLNTGANQPINVAGTWNVFGGATFIANSGTVTFDGDAQTINAAGQSFFNLTLSKPVPTPSATKTLAAVIDIGGKLTIDANVTLDISPSNYGITIAGNWENNGIFIPRSGTVTFNSISAILGTGPATFNNVTHLGALTAPSGTMTVSGNWSGASFPNSFNANGGTLHFNGAAQSISPGGQIFNHVTISGSNTKALGGIADIDGNLLLNGGTFNASTFQINLAGNFDASGGGIFIGTGADFNFDGASQTVTSAGEVFNNVTFSGSGTKGLADAFDANGFVTILNVALSAGSNNINVAGNWSTAGTGSFTSTGTTTFDGAAQIISSNGSAFGAVSIAGTNTKTLGDAFDANGNLTVTSALDVTTSNYAVRVGGNWNTSGGTFTARAGTVTLDGGAQNITLGANLFSSLEIAGSGTKAQQDNLALSGNLTINSGILSAGTNRTTLAGNWTNNAVNGFLAGTGVNGFVAFTGSSLQTISGSAVTDFSDIQITNTAAPVSVTVASDQNLHGVLTLSANSVFDADGSTNAIFTLVSSGDSPTSDASIFTLPAGASVTGNVTVQRFMSLEGANNTRIYRYIASPVQTGTVAQIQATIPVTGSFATSSSCSGCDTNQSMFLYNESVLTDTNGSGIADRNDGYEDFPINNNSEVLTPGVGYAMYVRGNILSSGLWSVRGPINAGNLTPVTLPVTYTPTGGGAGDISKDGWNLVGNPYPSTIDWLGAGWSKTALLDEIHMLDNGLATPVYATFVGGSGTNGGSRYIASGQAFWVKSNGGTPALTASETVKASGTQTTFFRTASIENFIRVTLKQGNKRDETLIKFNSDATSNFDTKWDAHKLANPGTMFSLSSFGPDNVTKYAINTLKSVNTKSEVKLDLSGLAPGNYSLEFSDFNSFTDSGLMIYLKDAFLGKVTNIRQVASYSFQVTTDQETFGGGRFSIIFEENMVTAIEETTPAHISIYPNPTHGIINIAVHSENEVKASVVSLMGIKLSEKTLVGSNVKRGSFDLEEHADGMYLLLVHDGPNVYQTRIIKKR